MNLNQLSASQAVEQIARRKISSVEYVTACLERIAQREPDVHAWACIDPELALEQARACDQRPTRGLLHGIPIGVKDVIDTATIPTQYNSPIYRGHQPAADASCVALTVSAGGIVLGKTVTTEFAYRYTGPTRNPHNLDHTPGGSSSGSAAAVADCMVPIAIGTQTSGSTIRPSSFCGVVGYKPSFNLVNRAGLKFIAESLDTIGVIARTVEDAALYVHAIAGIPRCALSETPSNAPRIGFCRTPRWSVGELEMQEKLEFAIEILDRAGAQVTEIVLDDPFENVYDDHAVIIHYEAARALAYEYAEHRSSLSDLLKEDISRGLSYSRSRYELAQERALNYRRLVAKFFSSHDFLLTPSAPGTAPLGITHAGDSIFNRIWTLFGTPTVTIPVYAGSNGLPLGIQVVGPHFGDAQTLYWAEWTRRTLVA